MIIEAEVKSSAFLFINIYAPNKVQEQCDFFGNVNKTIEILSPIKSTKFLSDVT